MNSPAAEPERIGSDVHAALGQNPVDLILTGGWIINVYSGEMHRGDVAVYQGRIVAIREKFAGPARRSLDVSGKYIAPALVDSIFQKESRLAPLGNTRGIGLIAHTDSRAKRGLRPRETTRGFLETRHALRNGRTAFLDERIGSWALGVLLEEVRRQGLDFSQICFAVDPEKPAAGRDHPVRVAMQIGFSAPQAFQLAALNPAVHYGIDDQTGSVAPGRVANLLIIDDLTAMRVEGMIKDGEELAVT
jgi:adenine deaminase